LLVLQQKGLFQSTWTFLLENQLCVLPYHPYRCSRCLQEDCGLVVDFASFPALLLKLLNLLVEQPTTYLGLLVLRADGSAVLEFAQNLEFKAMSLLSMRVEAVPQVGDGQDRLRVVIVCTRL
jgi:hypothetical protein